MKQTPQEKMLRLAQKALKSIERMSASYQEIQKLLEKLDSNLHVEMMISENIFLCQQILEINSFIISEKAKYEMPIDSDKDQSISVQKILDKLCENRILKN